MARPTIAWPPPLGRWALSKGPKGATPRLDRGTLVGTDGYLYVTANQLYRQAIYQGGKDLRRTPYALFRVNLGIAPVLLRR